MIDRPTHFAFAMVPLNSASDPIVPKQARGDATRHKIKDAARRLFATRGLNAVSVKDIVTAAGQKNGGSMNYYFRTKEALIAEIAADGALIIAAGRNRRLDALEATGGPTSVRQIVEILADLGGAEEESEDTLMRFLTMLIINERELFVSAMANGVDNSLRRCAVHIYALLPHIPLPLLSHRVQLLTLYLATTLASQEIAHEHAGYWKRFWSHRFAFDNFLDSGVGLLTQPASEVALAALAKDKARPRRTRRA